MRLGVGRDLGAEDLAFPAHLLGRHVVSGDELRADRGHVHREVTRQRIVATLERDDGADASAVQVRTQRPGRADQIAAAHTDVLADPRDQCAARFVNGLTRVEPRREQRIEARRLRGERRLGNSGRERLEIVLARNEVRLGVHFDDGGRTAVGRLLDRDDTFGGDAAGLLVRLGKARLPHDLGRSLEIAVGFDERLLALHHAGAGALAQFLDEGSGDFSHGGSSWK